MIKGNTNIFILEDDSLQQYSLKRTLESLGYRVVGCTASAQEAVESLQALQDTPADKPSLLLVDIRLRGPVDGIEFVASLPPELKVPHIFITAFNDEQHFARSIQTNPAGYILKPFGKLSLDYQIRLALRNQENEIQLLEKNTLLDSFLSGSKDGIILIDKEGRILEWSKSSEIIFGIPREIVLSRTPKELDRSLSILSQNQNSSLLEVKREIAEGVQHLQITHFPVRWKNEAYTCFIVRDVTFLKQAEESILQANRELSVLNQALAAIGKSFRLEEVLLGVLQILIEGLQASGGVLYLFDESSETLQLSCSRGISPTLQKHLTPIKLGETILGQIAQSDYTLGIDNLTLEPNRLPAETLQEGWKSLLAVPIKRESKLFGLIALFSTEKQSFNPAASRLLTTVAHELSISLENTLLYQKTREINIELEQKVTERTQDLNTLAELSRELTFIVGYRELFTVLFSLLHRTSSFAAAAVYFHQESSPVVFLYYGSPVSEEFDGRFREKIEDYVLSATDNQVFLKPEMFFTLNERVFPPEREDPSARLFGELYVEPFEQKGDLYSHKGYLFFTAQGKQKFQDRERHLFLIAAQHTTLMLQALEYRLGIEKKRLEQVVANLPVGLWIIDRNGMILVQNPQALELIQGIASKEQTPYLLETIRTLPGGQKTFLELDTPSKRYLEITAEPINSGPDAEGKIVLLRDLTEERLKDEQMKAQERLAAVGQLAAGIAHDFNNILTGIIGYCEYLQLRKDVGSEIRVYLLKIIDQAKRAGTLVQQILDFSRKSMLEHKPLDLVPFLKEMSKLFSRIIGEHIQLSWNIRVTHSLIQGNPVQIQQILMNLLCNAKDALPAGGTIQVSLDRVPFTEDIKKKGYFAPDQEPTGPLARLTIEDNGVGIPKEVLPRVFEPFFTTKPVGKGTGLGLAQVYGLVQQHKGAVYIESEVGKGTRVTLLFPLIETSSPETSEGFPLEFPETTKGWILFVEDEEEVRKIIAKTLEEMGYQILQARNGKEALELFQEHQEEIELIITDVVMPEMDGQELVKRIRSIDPRKKIVFTTGYPMGKEGVENGLPEVEKILYKPLHVSDIIKTIEAFRSLTGHREAGGTDGETDTGNRR